MKWMLICLMLGFSVPLHADEVEKPVAYAFDFKVSKQREERDRRGGAANNTTDEVWSYKVEVLNKALEELEELEVKYRIYVSTETQTGGSRKETTRTVAGVADLDAIARGNGSVFETKSVALKQSEKTSRSTSKKKGSQKKTTQVRVTEVTEKLDGIWIELFSRGKKVGESVLGDAAKRAELNRKKK